MEQLDQLTKSLRNNSSEDVVVAVYVKGDPASGKTQVAREFGEKYYKEKKSAVEQTVAQQLKKLIDKRKMVTVSTLYARSESAILRAYLRLAIDLECPLRLYSAITEEEQLTVLQAEIQQKLRSEVHRDWLLVIDGMTTKSMLLVDTN